MLKIVNITSKLVPYFINVDKDTNLFPVDELLEEPTLKQLSECGLSYCFLPEPFYRQVQDGFLPTYDELKRPQDYSGQSLIEIYSNGSRQSQRALRRYLTELSKGDDISYKQACELRELIEKTGFNLCHINLGGGGFWGNTTNMRNMFFVALDTLGEDFKIERENYLRLIVSLKDSKMVSTKSLILLNQNTENLSGLIREKVLQAPGGSKEFIRRCGLVGLTSYRGSLKDGSYSFGSLLRRFLPGLIDENNQYALRPHEVEGDWWNNKEYAEKQVLRALTNVDYDLKVLLNDYSILYEKKLKAKLSKEEEKSLCTVTDEIANIVRNKILLADGGGIEFLRVSGFSGLVGAQREFFDRVNSIGSVLRCFVPDLVDEDNEHALQPHELEDDWWNNENYARVQVFRTLSKLNGFQTYLSQYFTLASNEKREKESDSFNSAISGIANIVRRDILQLPGGSDEFLKQSGFYGLVVHKRDFLDKRCSLGSVLRHFIPGLVDEDNEHALQPHELEEDHWYDLEYSRKQFFRVLGKVDGIPGLLEKYIMLQAGTEQIRNKRKNELVFVSLEMAKIIRKNILQNPGAGTAFIKQAGLGGLTDNKSGFLDKSNSLGALLRCFLPEVAQQLY